MHTCCGLSVLDIQAAASGENQQPVYKVGRDIYDAAANLNVCASNASFKGAGIAQWLEHRTRD